MNLKTTTTTYEDKNHIGTGAFSFLRHTNTNADGSEREPQLVTGTQRDGKRAANDFSSSVTHPLDGSPRKGEKSVQGISRGNCSIGSCDRGRANS